MGRLHKVPSKKCKCIKARETSDEGNPRPAPNPTASNRTLEGGQSGACTKGQPVPQHYTGLLWGEGEDKFEWPKRDKNLILPSREEIKREKLG